MAKDPAMLFYTKDFLTGVAFLSMKERGQYITLLCLQQQLGHMSLKQMESAVGKISQDLMDKFVEDEQGLWYNVRAEVEIGKRQAHCEKQRETIMKRWNKTPADDTSETTVEVPRENHGNTVVYTTVLPLANANANIPVSSSTQGKKERKEEEFNRFWEAYPRKIGKQAARKAFDKIPTTEIPKLVPAVEAQKSSAQWTRENGRYIPNPATWLNQGRWDDEVRADTAAPTKRFTTAADYEKMAKPDVDLDKLKALAKSMGAEV